LLISVAAVSLVALAVHRRYPPEPPPDQLPYQRRERYWLMLWALLLGCWVGHIITAGLWQFPSDWDSLAYHIPLVDCWLQTRSLNTTGCSRWANPGNNELLALWAVAPFSGDFLVSLNNLPAAMLFACSTVTLATRLGLPRTLAHLAGFGVVCNSVVLKQLVDEMNDVAVVAWFFAALSYALRYAEKPTRASLVLGSISLGLLAGVKYYALGYAALAFITWVLLAASLYGRRAGVRVLVAGAMGMVVCGGYWYLRNWLMTGSPLYPREPFKHPDLLSHIYPEVGTTSFFGNRQPQLLWLYAKAVWSTMGPYQLAGLLLAPVSLLWLLDSAGWLPGPTDRAGRARVALAGLLIGTALLLGVTPFAVEDSPGTLNQMRLHYSCVRYGLCFLSLTTLPMLIILRDLIFANDSTPNGGMRARPSPWLLSLRAIIIGLLAGTTLFQLSRAANRVHIRWIADIVIGLDILAIALVLGFLDLKHLTLRPGVALLVLMVPMSGWAWACAVLSDHWHAWFIPHYREAAAFSGVEQTINRDSPKQRILVLRMCCYPFFGSRRQHRVYQPVYVYSSRWLMELLHEEDIHLVAAETEGGESVGTRRFGGFQESVARYPEVFSKVRQESTYTTYRVVKTKE
jgi:hypothetical protein